MSGHSGSASRAFTDAVPMTPAYFALILRQNGTTARDRAALLAGTGVGESALADVGEITLGQQLRQLHNADRLLDPGWSLAVGAGFHAATHGPMGFAVVTAPTLRESLGVMTRFGHVRSPHFTLRAVAAGPEIRLVPRDRVALDAGVRRALVDIVLLSMQAMIESVLGRPMGEARFEVPYAAPEYARRYRDCFHAPVRFGCAEAALVVPAPWASLECPMADPVIHAASVRRLEAGERRLRGGSMLVARAEQLLAARGERLGVDTAARVLGVSRRTLGRRLHETGTSYRALRDLRRRQQAETLLSEPALTVAEVAWALGYEDAANFGRACRRWFGASPGTHRRRLLDLGPSAARDRGSAERSVSAPCLPPDPDETRGAPSATPRRRASTPRSAC